MKAFGNIAKDSQVRAVASGAISSGKPVAINSDGTVSEVSGADAALGTESAFNSSTSSFLTTVFDSSNNKHIIVYRQGSNMRYVVATVASDGGVTFGTDAVAESSDNQQIAATFDSTNNRIVVVYRRGDDSDHGYALVGSLSGTTVTWGSPTEFVNSTCTGIGISFDSTAGKVVITYRDYGNSSYGTARVGTVSGTSISFGTAVVFNSGTTEKTRSVHDSTNNKTVVSFSDGEDSAGKGDAVVGTISGTDISFGSSVRFEAGAISHSGIAFDSDTGKVVIAYRQNHETDGATTFKRGTAIVGTVSGTSISFGTAVAFDNTGDYGENTANSVIYDSNAKKVLVVYPRTLSGSYSNRGFVFPLKVSGTTIVADTGTDFAGATAVYPAISFDSNVNKNLIAFGDGGNSEYGTAVSFSPASTNLTSENYIGMSSGVAFQTGSAAATGTAVVFEGSDSPYVDAVYDSNAQKHVMVYSDGNNSYYGTAIVGTVDNSDNSISFGSSAVFESAAVSYVRVGYDANAQKVVIIYRDEGNSNYGTAVVGTVSGTSISFGTPVVFNSAGNTIVRDIAYDANAQKVVIAFRTQTGSFVGTAIVGTVSGTSISFGSSATYNNGNTGRTRIAYDSNAQKHVFAYEDGGNSSHGTAVVGTVSGTDISFGSEVVFEAAQSSEVGIVYDSDSQKVIIGYRDQGDSDIGKAIVGTVSGTSISFGTVTAFGDGSGSGGDENISVAYDTNADKVVVAFSSGQSSGKVNVGTVSGTSISFGTASTFESGRPTYINANYDSNQQRVVIAYADQGNSGHGTAVVFKPNDIVTTRGQIANSGKAVIDSTNTISRNQIGLTAGQTLYVQTDGTLSETADDPSVTAGTAISATELIVKG